MGLLLIVSITSVVWFSTRLFISDNKALIQQMNADNATSIAAQVRENVQNIISRMQIFGNALIKSEREELNHLLTDQEDFLALFLYASDEKKLISYELASPMKDLDSGKGFWDENILSLEQPMVELKAGEAFLDTMPILVGNWVVVVGVPFMKKGTEVTHGLIAFIDPNKLRSVFSTSDLSISYLINLRGRVLAHPDQSIVETFESYSDRKIVAQMIEAKLSNGQMIYEDPMTGEGRLGAYRMVGFGGLGVVTEIPEGKAFEASLRVEYRALLLSIIVLCVSFLTGYLFSGTITWPLQQLVVASEKIKNGDFKIRLTPKTKDEVADLSLAFNEMAMGLEERDRVKAVFQKFHQKEVAEKLLSGEVRLGGERKEAAIFFSDIRGFTQLSESMDPHGVVELLNEYLSKMVAVISQYGGVVDKYVGDAIMAIWGVPVSQGDDTKRALMACLEMREELKKLNELRVSRGQAAIKIGMGLNVGPVVSGNIGSNERMEYTVIGDSVNLAARVESMTKDYGVDLLVTQRVYEAVQEQFIFELCDKVMVRGKTVPVEVYRVLGYYKGTEQVLVHPPDSEEKEPAELNSQAA